MKVEIPDDKYSKFEYFNEILNKNLQGFTTTDELVIEGLTILSELMEEYVNDIDKNYNKNLSSFLASLNKDEFKKFLFEAGLLENFTDYLSKTEL